jgi:hypothetical protein
MAGALQSDTLFFGASAAHRWAAFFLVERWQLVNHRWSDVCRRAGAKA